MVKKKFVAILLAGSLVTGFAFSATAARYQPAAEALSSLGLFKGTEAGFELDRAPTRAEAAVMMVRLLGKESEALRGTYQTPFTDIPAWCSPYIGYLYQNGIAGGMSKNTFEPDTVCNERMYPTFVLRALGYRDREGDFTYDEVAKKASEVGVWTIYDEKDGYTRDNVAATSYLALAANLKDSETILLEYLVSKEAVPADIAKIYKEKFELLDQASTMVAPLDGHSFSAKLNGKATLTVNGRSEFVDLSADLAINRENKQSSFLMEMEKDGVKITNNLWNSEDVTYSLTPEGKVKETEIFSSMARRFDLLSVAQPDVLVKNIKAEKTETGTRYEVDFYDNWKDNFITALCADVIPQSRKLISFSIILDADSKGNLTSGTVYASYDIPESAASVEIEYTISHLSLGSATVTLPTDLEEYK